MYIFTLIFKYSIYVRTYMYIIFLNLQIPHNPANIIMYNITVMDQYSPAIVTVPANMSFVKISELSDSDTSIVANRAYIITVSAITNDGISCPSDPVVSKCLYMYR